MTKELVMYTEMVEQKLLPVQKLLLKKGMEQLLLQLMDLK